MQRKPQPALERAVLLLRAALLPGWSFTASQGLVWAVRGVIVLGVIVLVASAVDKSLWAWLNLLIVPLVLAIGGYLFNNSQNRATEAAAERRAQDEALQAYLDQMSNMLIPADKDQPSLYKARAGDSLSAAARARTLTVLPRLNGGRKARVVQFLYEAGLIAEERILDLSGADLSGADLSGAGLDRSTFRRAGVSTRSMLASDYMRLALNRSVGNLSDVNLSGVDLSRANLCGISLARGNLRDANLRDANLSGTVLLGTDMSGADLMRADFTQAILLGADLSRTDLSDATGWPASRTQEQFPTPVSLEAASSLEGATMPNRQRYEDWLKSRGKGGSATPEQRGPWWGGPYHRGIWRRLFGG